MPDASAYSYPRPLAGYENAPALPNEIAADGKSYINLPSDKLSTTYERFTDPIENSDRGGFDVHIYYDVDNPAQRKYAHELWERIRREFPELRIYKLWDRLVGPHTLAMFEVNLFTPAQFGAFVAWLVIYRGPLSVLVHPNTDNEERDHSALATWMGPPIPIKMEVFRKVEHEPAAQNGVPAAS